MKSTPLFKPQLRCPKCFSYYLSFYNAPLRRVIYCLNCLYSDSYAKESITPDPFIMYEDYKSIDDS